MKQKRLLLTIVIIALVAIVAFANSNNLKTSPEVSEYLFDFGFIKGSYVGPSDIIRTGYVNIASQNRLNFESLEIVINGEVNQISDFTVHNEEYDDGFLTSINFPRHWEFLATTEGRQDVKIKLTDSSGDIWESESYFILDRTGPTIETDMKNGILTIKDNYDVKDVNFEEVLFNNQNENSQTSDYLLDVKGEFKLIEDLENKRTYFLPEGKENIIITSTDNAGNVNEMLYGVNDGEKFYKNLREISWNYDKNFVESIRNNKDSFEEISDSNSNDLVFEELQSTGSGLEKIQYVLVPVYEVNIARGSPSYWESNLNPIYEAVCESANTPQYDCRNSGRKLTRKLQTALALANWDRPEVINQQDLFANDYNHRAFPYNNNDPNRFYDWLNIDIMYGEVRVPSIEGTYLIESNFENKIKYGRNINNVEITRQAVALDYSLSQKESDKLLMVMIVSGIGRIDSTTRERLWINTKCGLTDPHTGYIYISNTKECQDSDLTNTILHEILHHFTLGHELSDRRNIMYTTAISTSDNRILTWDQARHALARIWGTENTFSNRKGVRIVDGENKHGGLWADPVTPQCGNGFFDPQEDCDYASLQGRGLYHTRTSTQNLGYTSPLIQDGYSQRAVSGEETCVTNVEHAGTSSIIEWPPRVQRVTNPNRWADTAPFCNRQCKCTKPTRYGYAIPDPLPGPDILTDIIKRRTPTIPVFTGGGLCRNGRADPGEQCGEPGLTCPNNLNCNIATCKCDNICGNGFVLRPQEECDDGNIISGDGCSSDCKIETCGCGDFLEEYPQGVVLSENCGVSANQCGGFCTIRISEAPDVEIERPCAYN